METLINGLLDHPSVKVVLAGELDLLMVDEFQDTSPIQLELFLKLSRLARYSVWVGDPKQSIYGFRGAEPRLMEAIIRNSGGIKPENIQEHSWRSREDIVFAANAIFTKAFNDLPAEQVALKPKRTKTGESGQAERALHHWHFKFEGEGRPRGGRGWRIAWPSPFGNGSMKACGYCPRAKRHIEKPGRATSPFFAGRITNARPSRKPSTWRD